MFAMVKSYLDFILLPMSHFEIIITVNKADFVKCKMLQFQQQNESLGKKH